MPDFNIPMSMASAAAGLDTRTPLSGDPRAAERVNSFAPIDMAADTTKAYRLAETQEDFKEMQSKNLEAQAAREEKQRDRQQLEMVRKAGLNLSNPEDLEKAKVLLNGKLSDTAMQGLEKRYTDTVESRAKTFETLRKMDSNAIAKLQTAQDQAVTLLSGPVAAYEDSVETVGEAAATQKFNSAKAAMLTTLANEKNPVTGQPAYPPEMLKQLEGMSPQEMKNRYERTVEGSKHYGMVLREKREEDLVKNREDKLDIDKQKLGLMKQKIDKNLAAGANYNEKDAEALAEQIANKKADPISQWGMNKPFGQHVMSLVYEKNPNYSVPEYQALKGIEKAFAYGKQGNAVRSFNVLTSHLDTLAEAGKALENYDTKAFNQIGNKIAAWRGEAPPAEFEAIRRVVADEVVKAITGAGGALADREEAQRTIDSAASPKALAGVIKKYKELSRGQLSGLRTQYEAGGGKDFNKFLTDEAKAMFEEAGTPAKTGAPKSGGAKEPAASPAGFPKVTPEEQKARDADAVLQRKGEVQELEKALASAKTDEEKSAISKTLESAKRDVEAMQKNATSDKRVEKQTAKVDFKPAPVAGFKGAGSKSAPYVPAKNEDLAQLKKMSGAFYMKADDPNHIYQVP
jgi:hypothetical protein